MRPVRAGNVTFDGTRLGVIAGPCVIESEGLLFEVATELRRITRALDLPFIFKASYAKDNRSSVRSFRGPGLENGLGALAAVRER